jgi:hypothetical protein
MSGRLTPPSIQDGPLGWEPGSISHFEDHPDDEVLAPETAQKLGVEIYSASTSWISASRRADWANSLRAFQNRHPQSSKYRTRDYAYRSDLFRPKTRSMVRNDEAQTATAFFANDDVVSIQPGDEDDPIQAASAEMMQQLLQYRLTRSEQEGGVPWFLTLVGARQDAEVMGVCCAEGGWRYEEEYSHTEHRQRLGADGMASVDEDGAPLFDAVDVMRKVKDQPFVDLIPVENIRFEPGADWRDPINSSPYVIQLKPMYIQDVQAKMDDGEWFRVAESALRSAVDRDDDTTRRSREQGRVPGKDHDSWKPRAFDIAWVRRNIVKWKGRDWHFYTLGSAGELLTDPVPLEKVELHGLRPYVLGYVVVETHKTYPASKVELVADLQRATNDDWNLRFDNVKMALNPRQFVKAGHGIEQQDLTRFAPGKVVTVTAAKDEPIGNNIIAWDRPPEPGASAYAEQDRINLDWDELTGAFTNSSIQASQIQQQSATGMHLMSGIASGMNEYELRVFAETFVEPLVRLLVRLEQAYETDPVILALAGKKAQLFQKYGLNHITDELLNQNLTTRVNVGIGATNPTLKLRNLFTVGDGIGKLFGPIAAQKIDFDEIYKELMGLAGYKDGERFLRQGAPSVQEMQLQAQVQKLQGKGGAAGNPSALPVAQINAQSKQQVQQMKADSDARSDAMEMQRQREADQAENWREWIKAQAAVHSQATDHAADMAHAHMDRMHEVRMTGFEALHNAAMARSQQQFDAAQGGVGRAHERDMAGGAQQHQVALAKLRPAPGAGRAVPTGSGPR